MVNKPLDWFESIARRSRQIDQSAIQSERNQHPFDNRNIHPRLPTKVKELFDDGHFSQATFEAYKFLDKEIQRLTSIPDSGYNLMTTAFSIPKQSGIPNIRLTALSTPTEIGEQEGYMHLFAGAMKAIRNPRGHEYNVIDDPDTCLAHLSFASMLLTRLEESGYK